MVSQPALTRRHVVAGAAAAGAGLLAYGGSTFAVPEAPRFVASSKVKGIDTVPPMGHWTDQTYGLTDRRVEALHSAGFNTLRVFVSLRELTAAQNPATGINPADVTKRWVDYVGRGLAAGFRVLVSWNSTYEDRLAICGAGDASDRFRSALTALAGGLAAAFDPGLVALEVMNEPPEEARLSQMGLRSWSSVVAPLLVGDIRGVAPQLTIVVQSASGGWAEAIPGLVAAAFDENTIFCFHFYTPGEFTHQGLNYPDFDGIPFPVTRYRGGRDAMTADILGRVAADPTLGAADRLRWAAEYKNVLQYLWGGDAPLGPDWVVWPKLDAWIAAYNINPARLICGEFGVVSNVNFNRSHGTDVESRAGYLRAVRRAVETHDFGGWIVHQALGDFNLFEEQGVGRHGDRLIPELVNALFA